jgi:hypothetical protein
MSDMPDCAMAAGYDGYCAGYAQLNAECDCLRAELAEVKAAYARDITEYLTQLKAAEAERDTLRAELASWQEAFGLLTTLHGQMEINVSDPMGMAQAIEKHVSAEVEGLTHDLGAAAVALGQSHRDWLALRAEVEGLTRERDDTIALYLVARNKAARLRMALEQLVSACRTADIGYLDQPIDDAEDALRGEARRGEGEGQ